MWLRGGSIACPFFKMTIAGLKRKFDTLDTDTLINNALSGTQNDIRDLNLEQMYDGKTSKGVDITPSYVDDPYWDEHGGRAAAQAYSDWKDKITPSLRRNPGTPNLFINGYYHSSISVIAGKESIVWASSFNSEPDIRSRFKHIYGLGGRYKTIYLREYLAPILRDRMFELTGLLMRK
jgi:hypothetical protein